MLFALALALAELTLKEVATRDQVVLPAGDRLTVTPAHWVHHAAQGYYLFVETDHRGPRMSDDI